jgi:hypothetical protein
MGGEVEIRWRTISRLGFPFAIAEFAAPEGRAAYSRKIYVQLDPSSFTDEKLKQLFLSVAETQPQDKDLFIYAYSDRSDAEYSIRDARSLGFVLKKSEKSPKADANSRRSPGQERSEKVCRAYYLRTPETEEFAFNTDPLSKEDVRVVLRPKVIPYTGVAHVDLTLAAYEGDRAKVVELLSLGTDVNAISEDGSTSLMLSILKRQDAIFQPLLAHGANVNAKNLEGWTALMYAAANEDIVIVQQLIDAGARVNERNHDGDAALSLAVAHRSGLIVQMLLEKGALPDLQDEDGDTALSQAVLKCDREMVSRLLAAGASTTVRNKAGETALDQAKREAQEVERIIVLLSHENKTRASQYVARGIEQARAKQKSWAGIIELLNKH